jgi:PAS domain S-box-containing protein
MSGPDAIGRRLAALARLGVVDAAPDAMLDKPAATAARLLRAPIATIDFFADGAVWRKACHGGRCGALSGDSALARMLRGAAGPVAGTATPGEDPMLRDPSDSRRFALVAAAPLSDGEHRIGALCVLDDAPRAAPEAADLDALRDLAAMIVEALSLRRAAARARVDQAADERRARILGLAAELDDMRDMVGVALRELRDATGARAVAAARLSPDGGRVVPVGVDAETKEAAEALLAHLNAAQSDMEASLSRQTIAAGRPSLLRAEGLGGPAGELARSLGVATLALCPMALGGERYLFSIGLAANADGSTDPLAAILNILDMLRPLLLRLRDAERAALLRRVIDASGEGVMIAEAATPQRPTPRIIYANPTLCRMTGYEISELLGASPYMMIADKDPALEAEIARAVMAGRSHACELRNRRKDGSTFWAAVSISPVPDATGAVTHSLSIRRDVTAEREEAARLIESEAAFRSMFQQNPIPMWIFDRQTLGFIEVNDAAVQSYGYSRERFATMTMLDIRPPEDRALARAVLENRGEGRREIGPYRHVDAWGRIRDVLIMSNRLRHGGRDAVMVAVWDVTERLRAEGALRDAQRLARIGAWRWRAGSPAPDWSAEALEILGGQPVTLLDDDAAALRDAFAAASADEAPVEFDFRVARADGRVAHFHALGRRARDETGETVVDGYVQDVTEAREAVEGLRRSERLSAIGQLTGGVAHDFNNLLTIALGNVEMAQERIEDPQAGDMLRAARAAIDRGARLTAQLLAFARRQPLASADVPLEPFLANLLQLVGRTIGETHGVTVKLDPDASVARCDPTQLEASLLNLILNARDATPRGGRIRIRGRRATADEGSAAGVDHPWPMLALSVADDGPGIPPEMLERVTEPFFSTKPPGKGAGMGLSTAQGFARQTGGELILGRSTEGGLEATLLLPASDARPIECAAPATAPDLPPEIEILAVEDDGAVREATAAMLRALGASAVCVGSAEEALAMLSSGIRFDLLFSDVVLGGPINGIELARKARAILPDLAVLLATGYSDALFDEADRDDLPPVLPKPYSPSGLRVALVDALARAAARAS